MLPFPQQSDSIQLSQFMPGNAMLPPPAISKAAAAAVNAAGVADRQLGRFFRIAVFSTILFFILSFPATYRIVNHVFSFVANRGNEIVGEDGCPTLKGSFIHSGAFFAIMMYIVYR